MGLIGVDVILALIVGLLAYVLYRRYRQSQNMFPGPTGIPFLGVYHRLDMKKGPNRTFHEWAKKYGKTFSCKIGTTNALITEDLDMMDEMFRKFPMTFNGRVFDIPDWMDTPLGFAELPYGKKWREIRGFVCQILNAPGLCNKTYDEMIAEEFQELSTYVCEKYQNKPFFPFKLFLKAVANILVYTMFKERYHYEDTSIDKQINASDQVARSLSIKMLFVTPLIVQILARKGILPIKSLTDIAKCSEIIEDKCHSAIKQHQETIDHANPRDLLDLYLLEIEKQKEKENGKTFLTENSLKGAAGDIFAAGLESTATMLSWTVLLMCLYPDVQAKVQKEVDEVVGHERHPRLKDRENMPYTKSVIQESLRFVTVSPLGVFHKVQKNTNLRGYFVPHNTLILTNLWGLHRNEEIFPDADSFKPERFLDSNGRYVRNKYVIPFGIGMRTCPGEVLALRELFLFLANLVQKFEVKLKPGSSPDLDGVFIGIGLFPPDFESSFTLRECARNLVQSKTPKAE